MKIYFYLLFMTIFYHNIYGQITTNFPQNDSTKNFVLISPTVYNIEDSVVKEIIILLNNYFKYIKTPSMYFTYWTDASKNNYNRPDYLLQSAIAQNNKYKCIPNLIFVGKQNEAWNAKIAFNAYDKGEYKGLVFIYNIGIRKENNILRLFNVFDETNLRFIKADECTFFSDEESNSDTISMNRMIRFNNKLSNIFNSKINFKYVNVRNEKKLNNLMGFDFNVSMNILTPVSGLADVENNIIYSSNNSFYYPHELVHLYVSDYKAHQWFNEGLATYLGGSMGLTLNQHLKKMKLYVKSNPTTDFYNLLELIRIDDITSFQYSIGGLFCKIAYDKEGYAGIFKLLKSGNTDEDFYKSLEQNIGVKRENLSSFIRKELEKY